MIIEGEIKQILLTMGLSPPVGDNINYVLRMSNTEIGYVPKGKIPLFEARVSRDVLSCGFYSGGSVRTILKDYPYYSNFWSDEFVKKQKALKHTMFVVSRSGRAIKKLIPTLSDKKVEEFVARFNKTPGKFEIWTDVTKAYTAEDSECLYSCMTQPYNSPHQTYQNWSMEFYEKNNVKILVLLKGDKVVGRALLWEGVEFKAIGKKTLMDRVYVKDSKDRERFKDYCEQQGWVRGYLYTGGDIPTNRGRVKEFEYNGQSLTCEIQYPLNEIDISFWPYTDTLQYGVKTKKKITLYNYQKENFIHLNSLEGVCPFPIMIYSEYEKKEIDQRDAVESVMGWISKDNSVLIDAKIYHRDMTKECSHCNNLNLEENLYYSLSGFICKKCSVETVTGERELKENCYPTYDKKWVTKDEAVLIGENKYSWVGDCNTIATFDTGFIEERIEIPLSSQLDANKDKLPIPIPPRYKTIRIPTGYYIEKDTRKFRW